MLCYGAILSLYILTQLCAGLLRLSSSIHTSIHSRRGPPGPRTLRGNTISSYRFPRMNTDREIIREVVMAMENTVLAVRHHGVNPLQRRKNQGSKVAMLPGRFL